MTYRHQPNHTFPSRFVRLLLLAASLVTLACLLAACGGKNGGTETGTNPVSTTFPETAVKETDEPTEATTEPVTEPPVDGIFEEPTHLDRFLEEKNSKYFTAVQTGITFNANGSVTLKPDWNPGDSVNATLTIKYGDLVRNCCNTVSGVSALPNGEKGEKVSAIVLTVDCSAAMSEYAALGVHIGRTGSVTPLMSPVRVHAPEGGHAYLIYDMNSFDRTADYVNTLTLDWAFGKAKDDGKDTYMTIYAIDFYADVDTALAAAGCTVDSTPERGELKMNASVNSLQEIMQPLFKGGVVTDETVLFIDFGDSVSLLYPIDEIISVTSFDRRTTYIEGRDYIVEDGRLTIPEGSSIPVMGSDVFYNYPGSIIETMHDGKRVPMYWGENDSIYRWQVCVSYTHCNKWDGFIQPSEAQVYRAFIEKLEKGEDVTVLFVGDSITFGANCSFLFGGGTRQHSFAMLVVESLADLFGYKVNFVAANLGNTSAVPKEYNAGSRGTITYINTAVGGWNTTSIVNNYDRYVDDFIKKYGCDLLIFAHGMNDGGQDPVKVTVANAEYVFNRVLEVIPDCSFMYVSTMLPNPEGIGWTTTQPLQEPHLQKSAANYRAEGVPCAVCCMTSTSRAVLDHKRFMDYTGNNVNHPNDFFSRIYAQTILQTLIGYDNLD